MAFPAFTQNRLNRDTLLNQVVVTAGRYEQSVKRMMVSTEIIKPYLIMGRNTTLMDRLLDQIPSVHVTDGQINIRNGSGWTYGVGSRVMVMLDDMPFLTGDAGQVKWNFLPIENVQQIEVVKGASSVLYGSSALSGIVHFRTEMAGDRPVTRFSAFTGIFSEPEKTDLRWRKVPGLQYGATAFHSFKKGKNGFALSANYFRDEGFRLGETEHRFRMNARFTRELMPGIKLALNSGVLVSDGSSFLLWESYKHGYTILDSQVTTTFSKNFYFDPTVSFQTGAYRHNVRGRWMFVSNDNTAPNPAVDQDNSSHNLFAEYQVQRYFTQTNTLLTAGFSNSWNSSNSPLYMGSQHTRNHAFFLQVEQRITPKLNVAAGGRFEYFNCNGVAEQKPVFRAGLNLEAARATFVRASIGQGYRYPSIAERYIQTSVGMLNIFPNPSLQSETGWNAEIGAKQGFSLGAFKGYFDAALFYTRYNHMIDFNLGVWKSFDPFNPFQSIGFRSLNIGDTRIYGTDLTIQGVASLGKVQLTMMGGYTFTQPEVLNADEVYATDSIGILYSFRTTRSDSTLMLKYRFRHMLKWDLQLSYQRFTLGWSFRYNSAIENIDAAFVTQPLTLFVTGVQDARNANNKGKVINDVRCAYAITDKSKLSIVVSNLFNREVMTRPADLRPPRLTVVQWSYAF